MFKKGDILIHRDCDWEILINSIDGSAANTTILSNRTGEKWGFSVGDTWVVTTYKLENFWFKKGDLCPKCNSSIYKYGKS